MKNLKAIHVTDRNITALYESETGERIAHEHARIGSPISRRGTWRSSGTLYVVTFGQDTKEVEAVSVAGLFAKTSREADSGNSWATNFRKRVGA